MQPSIILRSLKVRPLLVMLFCAPMLFGFSNSAVAVENIRNVTWDCSASLEEPNCTNVSVTFDADLISTDVSTGSGSFSILVHSPEQLLKHVALFSVGPMEHRPPEGTVARFQVEWSARCDDTRIAVQPGIDPGFLTYVHPTQGEVVAGITAEPVSGVADIVNGFWFSIRGYGRQTHRTQPLPGDKLACKSYATPDAGTIGVYFDPEGNSCRGTIEPGTPGRVYIIAKLAGATAVGISGAEFRFTGVPDSWQTYAVPNPDILSLGNPFASGVAAAFPCERPERQAYLLYTVLVTAQQAEQDVTFAIEGRDPPLNPLTTCPLLVACDRPVFTKHCVQAVSCFVNSSRPTACDTSVGVTAKTWSGVKELFR
jgi:hypothetical protein